MRHLAIALFYAASVCLAGIYAAGQMSKLGALVLASWPALERLLW